MKGCFLGSFGWVGLMTKGGDCGWFGLVFWLSSVQCFFGSWRALIRFFFGIFSW